jgi:putative N6-adenine-specific DNA methylase
MARAQRSCKEAPAMTRFEIFATAPPGLEHFLLEEIRSKEFASVTAVPGGVTFQGGWPDIWRSNLELRGATRILVRIGSFMAFHLAQLDKRATKFAWADHLPAGSAVRVEVTTRQSKIYHAGAAKDRIETALKANGYALTRDAALSLKARIDDNRVTLSLDTSGESLHKRGHKEAVGKAPLRETLAALFLRQAGYDGAQPLVDPMCGSGTFVIEAAEIALDAQPGRSRSFAFEHMKGFDPQGFAALRRPLAAPASDLTFYGADRDAGAARMATANAARAGLSSICQFEHHALTDLQRPDGPPGLVMVNPPYGARVGNKKLLFALYGALGATLKARFQGWRVGIVTSETELAKATALPFKKPSAPVPHGGLKVRLFQTGPL